MDLKEIILLITLTILISIVIFAFYEVKKETEKEDEKRWKDLNLLSDNDNYSDLVQKNNTEILVEKIIDPELKVCPYCAET